MCSYYRACIAFLIIPGRQAARGVRREARPGLSSGYSEAAICVCDFAISVRLLLLLTIYTYYGRNAGSSQGLRRDSVAAG